MARQSPSLIPAACVGTALVLVCIMDTEQLVLAVLGALMYALVSLPAFGPRRPFPKGKTPSGCGGDSLDRPTWKDADACRSMPAARVAAKCPKESVVDHSEVRQASFSPIMPVQLTAVGWDAEVDELASKILPSPASEEIVRQLTKRVKLEVSKVFPEADVMGFAFADLMRHTAFGVAVPDVDLVVRVKAECMHDFVRDRFQHQGATLCDEYIGKFKKIAIRTCTEQLVNNAGLKFRRSAFRGQEPKVTLLAPAASGFHSEAIPMDLSVNNASPIRNARLLRECSRLDPRSKALAVLVRRWAKDRGICFASKGHLSPYAWTLMTVYFLQVGVREEDPLLPPAEMFGGLPASAKRPIPQEGEQRFMPIGTAGKKSVGQLLREFFRFYAQEFDFRREVVCVRRGARSAPDAALALHIITHPDGVTTDVAPSIEDPFDRKQNVSSNMSMYSLLRLKEELLRADGLCSACTTSLSELLKPWAPSVQEDDVQIDRRE